MVIDSPRIQSDRQQKPAGSESISFRQRHIGPQAVDVEAMLEVLGLPTVEALIDRTVPQAIRQQRSLQLPGDRTEYAALAQLKAIASNSAKF